MVRDRTAVGILAAMPAETRAGIKFCEEGIEGQVILCGRMQAENRWRLEEIAKA